MKRVIKSDNLPTVKIVVKLHPIFYENSEIFSTTIFSSDPEFNKLTRRWETDNNPDRIINGPLSEFGEMLEAPISFEYERFIRDCKFVIENSGFVIIDSSRSDTSKKSEYVLVFGMKDEPCGRLVFEIRISDHATDTLEFPEHLKDEAVKYLNMPDILNGKATKAGIDFQIEQVIVGGVKNDSWDKALNRLYIRVTNLRKHVRKMSNQLKEDT